MEDVSLRPFSTRTRIALAIARAIAAARGDRDVSATHVALGLVMEGVNPAAAVLNHACAPLHVLRGTLEQLLGEPPGGIQPREVVVDATPGEAALVAIAEQQAEQWSHPYIGTEHLLVAILAQEASQPAAVFAAHGLSLEKAVAYLQAMRSGAAPPGPA